MIQAFFYTLFFVTCNVQIINDKKTKTLWLLILK